MDSIGGEARPGAGAEGTGAGGTGGTGALPGEDTAGDTDTALLVSGPEISWAG